MSNYIKSGNKTKIAADGELNIANKLPLGTYIVKEDEHSNELILEDMDDFKIDYKLYGDVHKNADMIINTFLDREKNTGVLFSGLQGSGKTAICKIISEKLNKIDISTIVINELFDQAKLTLFIKKITEPVLFIFDEFEKIYRPGVISDPRFDNADKKDNKDNQEGLLSLLDGLFSSKKLFIFTCNDDNRINAMLKNRPGRVFYHIVFSGVQESAIIEYCEENLHNLDYLPMIINIQDILGEFFSFDILKAIVEESNRYDESPYKVLKHLNIKPYSTASMYEVIAFRYENEIIEINEYNQNLHINPLQSKSKFRIAFRIINKDSKIPPEDSFVYLVEKDLVSKTKDKIIYLKNNIQFVFTKQEEKTGWDNLLKLVE